MTKRYSITSDEKEVAELNISPLIDMVFILLIFFIVTTVFVEEPGVDILKPPAFTSRPGQKQYPDCHHEYQRGGLRRTKYRNRRCQTDRAPAHLEGIHACHPASR